MCPYCITVWVLALLWLSKSWKFMRALWKKTPTDNQRYEHSEMLIYKVNMRNHSSTLQYMYLIVARVKWIQLIS
jgi:hypothetical protein